MSAKDVIYFPTCWSSEFLPLVPNLRILGWTVQLAICRNRPPPNKPWSLRQRKHCTAALRHKSPEHVFHPCSKSSPVKLRTEELDIMKIGLLFFLRLLIFQHPNIATPFEHPDINRTWPEKVAENAENTALFGNWEDIIQESSPCDNLNQFFSSPTRHTPNTELQTLDLPGFQSLCSHFQAKGGS